LTRSSATAEKQRVSYLYACLSRLAMIVQFTAPQMLYD